MIEIILNRLRGTGDVFFIFKVPITGTVLYASYLALVVGLLYYFCIYGTIDFIININLYFFTVYYHISINAELTAVLYGLITGGLFVLGESMGWGKWVGYLTADNHPKNYNDKEGYNFPFIHQTANLLANEKKHYELYCQIALGLRGFYWWILPYLFMAFIDLISYYEAVLFSILLGVLFPIACEIGKKLNYNGKFWIINYSRGWENQELIYGLFQGLFFNYVIITNIIN